MTELNDHELLAEFARSGSEVAFATLTARHVNLVYSAALRFCGNPHHCEEITQAVFIILARKASKLSPRVVLSGWLYQTARLTAANFVKGEIRRQRREQEAYMQSTVNETDAAAWEQLAPLLDEAMGRLGETDRNAVVLRFFENKTAAEVAVALKTTEAAAHKRVNRALEKLRKLFSKRGVTLSATLIAGAVSAGSVQAAPAGLATSISTVALTKGAAAGGSTLALVKGALKIMAWTKAKTAIVTGVVVLLAAGTTAVALKDIQSKKQTGKRETSLVTSSTMDTYLAKENLNSSTALTKAPPVLSVQVTHFPKQGGGAMWFDLENSNSVKALGRDTSLVTVLQAAYRFKESRMVLPKNLPDTDYDFMAALPNCSRKAFQDEVAQKTGFRSHPEIVNTDALLLKVRNTDAPGLKIDRTTSRGFRQQWGNTVYSATNLPVSDLAEAIEDSVLKRPVIDQTGLLGNYDIHINWEPHNEDSLNEVLLDQLGLELVPTNMPIEMLVVEKVK